MRLFQRFTFRLLAVLCLLPCAYCNHSAYAAGSSVAWTTTTKRTNGGIVKVYSAALTSDDATGAVSGTVVLYGYIVGISTNPDDTAAPDDKYVCVLNNADGADILGGALGVLDTANSELWLPLDVNNQAYPARVDGTYTLSCTAMGNSKQAVIRLSVQE